MSNRVIQFSGFYGRLYNYLYITEARLETSPAEMDRSSEFSSTFDNFTPLEVYRHPT